ncbi:MAG: T9SS type A sorting domain-containing protein [Bacteroidales bacterium]|nr:T9SS type A sorting domain-containing protein [Bacteroidales bacterium]
MKKLNILLTTFIMLLVFSVNAQQVEREMVVLEIATGTWCYYCPGAAMGAEDLIANGKDVAVIEYHNGDSYTNAYGNSRNNYYNVSGIPDAHFDGILHSPGGHHTQSLYSSYLPKYNQRKAIQSSYTINVTGTNFDFIDYTAEVTVEKVATSTASNIKLHFVLTESEIQESWQGMSELNFVERLMVPNQYGTSIDFSSGNTQVVNLNFSIEDDWMFEHCEVVVFLQNNSTKEILQGFKMPLIDFSPENNYDVVVLDIRNMPEASCSGTVAPSITIRNHSLIDLTQLDVNYYVNGSDLSTYQWTGTLGFLETADIDLASINFDVQENNTVTVYTTNPNGNPDEYTNNDTIRQEFETAMIVEQTVTLMLRLDDNPEEISWDIKNSAGEVLFSGGSYTTAGQTITEIFELDPTSCYLFSIYDTGGDGLQLPGFFLLYYGSNYNILMGTTFGNSKSTEFTTGYVGIEENITTQDFSVFPNPFTNKTNILFSLNSIQNVTIDVYNMIGEKVKTIKQGNLSAGSHTIEFNRSELSNGIYFITLNTGDKILTEKVMIN